MTVKTRLAPSPTGDPHVGTAYQALFGKLWAMRNRGSFVLRIEDTDRERSDPRHEQAILECLDWLGLTWDEGPFRQSERLNIYKAHSDMLLERGHAYRCFCTRERLDRAREEQAARGDSNRGYDRLCREMPEAGSLERAASGEPFVVRMKAPLEGECVFTDLLRGEIRKDWASIDDQVIMKSDGYPTYHLAVVVDDHLMEITHIIRGEEWINSVPKHILLYERFGWKPPVFCHLPLLRNPDRSKLSKRKNPTSIQFYREAGILPEALVNYLGMMGWSMPDGSEKFSFGQMLEAFDLKDIRLGGPVFDLEKLRWLNARYIREDHKPEDLLSRLQSWKVNPGYLRKVAGVVGSRMETLGDWGRMSAMFFTDSVSPGRELLTVKGMEEDRVRELLQVALWRLEELKEWEEEAIGGVFRGLSEEFGVKTRDLAAPFYAAITGERVGPPLFAGMEVLGPHLSRRRIMEALETLGGISGKKQKALEKRLGRG